MNSAVSTRPTRTYSIPASSQNALRQELIQIGATELPAGPHETWRFRLSNGRSQATIILYQSGKLVLSGHAPLFDEAQSVVEATGAGRVLQRNAASGSNGPPPQGVPPETEPHIGTDEAGKGDFFGPLVTAAVYVDGNVPQILRTLGVRDSKTVSDRELKRMALQVRQVVTNGSSLRVLAPKRYNELYRQMRSEGKNLNWLLAWAHARVIEDLIQRGLTPMFILSDQFGDKRYIETRLLVDTRLSRVKLLQMHRAEADIAVAAASILARDAFLGWLDQASKRLGVTLPKGASPKVIDTGKLLVGRMGAEGLKDYAKVSFKTMDKVLAEKTP